MRPRPLLLTALLAVSAAVAPSASAERRSPTRLPAEGACLTPLAPDGAEPPCNPALAPSEWATAHRASHESGSSPYPGPRPGDEVERTHVELPGLVAATFPVFSGPDAKGERVAWANTNGPFSVVKTALDGTLIDTWTEPGDDGRPPTIPTDQTATNVYNAVDRDGNYLLASGTGILVFGNSVPGDNRSPIKLLKRFELPARAQCRAPDAIVGLSVMPDGTVALGTKNGVVATVPRQPQRMTDGNVHALRLDPRCDDASVPTDQIEENSNSIASDDRGGIYVVTNRAQYRVNWNGHALRKAWEAEYLRGREAGAYTSSTRTPGSGASPDVVQSGPGSDRFVVITDGQPLVHLVYLWADRIPRDWKPVRPGASRRIACEVPVDFGRPDATKTSDEQSVLTRGYSSVVVDNTVPNEDLVKLLPGLTRTTANLVLGPFGTAASGIERIDWNPRTRTCEPVWANAEASIPNAVPSLSSTTGLVYGISNRDGSWGLQGVDFASGRRSLWVPAGPQGTENSFFAMTTVGPAGTIWTGTPFGLSIYRPRRPAAPPVLGCADVTPPRVRGVRVARVGGGSRVRVRARVTDRACGRPSALRTVAVRLGSRRAVRVRVRAGRALATLRAGGRRRPLVRVVANDAGANRAAAAARPPT